jgi:hypothetical protein
MAAQGAGLVIAMVLGGVIAYVATRKKKAGEPTLPPPAVSPFEPGAYDVKVGKDVRLAPKAPKPSHVWVSAYELGTATPGIDYAAAIDSGAETVEIRFLKPGTYEVSLYYKLKDIEPTRWTFVAE